MSKLDAVTGNATKWGRRAINSMGLIKMRPIEYFDKKTTNLPLHSTVFRFLSSTDFGNARLLVWRCVKRSKTNSSFNTVPYVDVVLKFEHDQL